VRASAGLCSLRADGDVGGGSGGDEACEPEVLVAECVMVRKKRRRSRREARGKRKGKKWVTYTIREVAVQVKQDRERYSEEELQRAEEQRPDIWGECLSRKACPFVSCRYHLYLDVLPTGSIKIGHPRLGPCSIKYFCALQVASRGSSTLEEIGGILNITRERVRQIEEKALEKVRRIRRLDAGVSIEVDGGMNVENSRAAREAGAATVVRPDPGTCRPIAIRTMPSRTRRRATRPSCTGCRATATRCCSNCFGLWQRSRNKATRASDGV